MTHESSLVLWEKISSIHLQLSYFLISSKIFSSGSLEFMMSRSFFLYKLGCIISWYTIDLWVKIDISPGYILSIFHVNLGVQNALFNFSCPDASTQSSRDQRAKNFLD